MSGLCQLGGVHPERLRLAATTACQHHVFYVDRGATGGEDGRSSSRPHAAYGHDVHRARRAVGRRALDEANTTAAPLARESGLPHSHPGRGLVPGEPGGRWGGTAGVLVLAAESAGGLTWRPCVASTDDRLLPCFSVRRA